MKKILFIISLLLLGNASFGQHTYKQSLVEGVLEAVFTNNDNQSYRFTSTIERSLNWRTGIILRDVSKEEYDQNNLSSTYKVESLNFVIESINEISSRGVFNDILNECGYKCILFEISYMTSDVEYVNFIYKIDINDLKKYDGSKSFLKSIIKDYRNLTTTNIKKH
jgi:hypothetical protein